MVQSLLSSPHIIHTRTLYLKLRWVNTHIMLMVIYDEIYGQRTEILRKLKLWNMDHWKIGKVERKYEMLQWQTSWKVKLHLLLSFKSRKRSYSGYTTICKPPANIIQQEVLRGRRKFAGEGNAFVEWQHQRMDWQ